MLQSPFQEHFQIFTNIFTSFGNFCSQSYKSTIKRNPDPGDLKSLVLLDY